MSTSSVSPPPQQLICSHAGEALERVAADSSSGEWESQAAAKQRRDANEAERKRLARGFFA
mgnify:CR=1 FL=1